MNSISFQTQITTNHTLQLPDNLPVGSLIKVTIEPLDSIDLTLLAQKAHTAYINAGGTPLSIDEINAEVQKRRGGISE